MRKNKTRETMLEWGKCLNTFQSIQYRMSASPGRMLFGERYVMQDAVDRKKMGVKEGKK